MLRKRRRSKFNFSLRQASSPRRRRLFFESLETRRVLAIDAALIQDISSGGDSGPTGFVQYGSHTYFRADDGVTGVELWRTDGSIASLFADLHPTSNSSPQLLSVANGKLFFTATTPTTNREVWATDGVSAPQVFDVRPGTPSSLPESLISFNGEIYFVADNGTGRGIWHTNGTAAASLVAGTAGLNPSAMIVSGGKLYFAATPTAPPLHSRLYVYDGVSVQALSISSGTGSYGPQSLVDFGGTVYFSGFRGSPATGQELFKVTGPTSVDLVLDIRPGPSDSNPALFTVAGTNLFFKANDGTSTKLWRTHSGGTQKVTDPISVTIPSDSSFVGIGSLLYFVGVSAGVRGIFTSDGTSITSLPATLGMTPDQLTNVGGQLYFVGTQPGVGRELWYLNSSTPTLVRDIQSGSGSSFPDGLTAIGSTLYFSADDGLVGIEPWIAKDFPAPPVASTTVEFDGAGNLVITDSAGGDTNDSLQLSRSAGNIIAYDPDTILEARPGTTQVDAHTVIIPISSISSHIRVNTLAGNDLLTVDSSMVSTGKSIIFSGGDPTSGPPGDALVISGPGAFGNVTHSFTNAADGSVNIDGYVVSYTGLEPVTDVLTATTRTFTFTGVGETVTLADSGAAGDTMSVISSTQGESVTFANPTGTLTINLNTGTDILNFNSLDSMEAGPAALSADLNINGDGSETVNFPSAMINLGAGTASVGIGGPIQTINFTSGGLQTTGTVNLTAAGTINTSGIATDVVAVSLVASASTGIDLDTTVTNITATNSGAGSIDIDETNGANLLNVSAANGIMDVSTTTEALNVTTVSASATVALTAVGAGGTITDANGAANNITAANLNATAAGPINLDTTVSGGIVASTTASGAITIDELDAVTLASVTAFDGLVDISAGGALTVSSVTANGLGRDVRLITTVGNITFAGTITASGDIVKLVAAGSIIDSNSATEIVALSASLQAGGSIGTVAPGGSIDTQITNLAAATGPGGVYVANDGALTIASVTFLGTVTGVTGSGPAVISAASPLTVAANVIMGGAVVLTAGESATDDVDNLTVNPGVTVQSTGNSVTLNSGDNTTINSTSSILAATTITINIDNGDADVTGETLTIASGAVVTASGGATFNGGAQADIFNFAPQPIGTAIVVNGNAPLVIPGDVLDLDLAGATGTTLTIDGTNDGTFTFTNRASVEYNSIEDLNALGGCYDLVLNMAAFGPGMIVRRGAPFVGTTLEVVNNSGPTVVFSADLADIASLKVNGTAGADTLTVDDVHGMVSFDPLCIPSVVFPDNPNSAGVARFYFDGDGGANALNFRLTESGTAQVYAIGSGAAPGAGEGEVNTTNTAGRDLVAYFSNLGPVGSVNRTGAGAAPGSLTVLGDANANTLITTAALGLTTVNPAGSTSFTFAPGGNYSSLLLQAAGGSDTYHINGEGAAGLDELLIPAIVTDSAGTDTFFVNDSTDTTGDVATITQVGIDGLNSLAGNEISFSGMEMLDVTATAGADTLTINLGGAVASPSSFAGLVTVNVRGNGAGDTMFLHVADSLTNAPLDFVNLFGDLGGDTFGSAADMLNPVLLTGQTQIAVHGGIAAATPGPGIAFNPFAEAGDKLFLDMTNTFSGTLVTPVVIVDSNGGNADSANTQTFRFSGIEDIDLYDGGPSPPATQPTNTAIGDFFLRATDQVDYIQFTSAAQVNPVFRVRVGNLYYPTNGGNYGPYTTGVSKIYAYGRGGNDTITMYNTRLNGAIFGEGGDDILTGGYGNDLIVGGSGNDRINGGAVGGNDEIWGDDFNPAIDTPSVASQTGTGNDQINTFGGADTVYGQGGNDIINTG
ncbi:MAG: hypothetical protein IAF94_06910, partial [Pirellulaceae bacterium]|nr:hypothetical protein [Pirellulaceae bacterium]